ncbi:HAD-IC family P-type ATPase [Agrobacterium genomosp. 3]|nr:HAD-IC family P-type ATPase [Agrobacterium tomkonis]
MTDDTWSPLAKTNSLVLFPLDCRRWCDLCDRVRHSSVVTTGLVPIEPLGHVLRGVNSPVNIGSLLGITIQAEERPGTIAAAVAVDRSFWGILYFSDNLREGIGPIMHGFKAAGVTRIILATGDRADVAQSISLDLPFDAVEPELSAADKIEIVNREKQLQPVLMIGDGVNDAPALAAADIGLAMGVHGSAAAAEAADAVLLVERLDRVVQGIEIARGCRQIALQSILIGSGLSICGMAIAAAGYLTPVQGAVLQEGIDILAILNALRALRIRA